jgi:pectate lyase
MKHFLTILFLAIATLTGAQDYYMTAPVGYGRNTTGGTGGTIITVGTGSVSDLKTALSTSGKAIIIVTKDITFAASDNRISAVISNKTLLGLKGVKLIQPNDKGILALNDGSNNVIIRNLIFEGPSAYDINGQDLLSNVGCNNLWVDHCEFYDGLDGNFDNTNTADNISISWCKFGYKKNPRAGGEETDDHRFTNLVGGSDSNATDNVPTDGHFSISFLYCYWTDNCKERMPRARNAQLHIMNCYYDSKLANPALGFGGGSNQSSYYVEGCVFDGVVLTYKAYSGTHTLTFVDCSSTETSSMTNKGTTAKPSYTYTALPKGQVKAAITGTCGAGATLDVTTAGVVSSPCNESGGNDPDPDNNCTSSLSAATARTFNVVVSTVTELKNAINGATAGTEAAPYRIFIKNGDYDLGGTDTQYGTSANGYLEINKAYVSLIGQSATGVRIIGRHKSGSEAKATTSTVKDWGTSNSTNVLISKDAKGFYCENITFENIDQGAAYPLGLALYTQGDQGVFKNVRLLGYQDTYQSPNNQTSRVYFLNSEIQGTVDFIFGGGAVLFDNCLLKTVNRPNGATTGNVITAPAEPTSYNGTTYGYVFKNCTIEGSSSSNQGGKYLLARPWKTDATSVWINTTMKIQPSGALWAAMSAIPKLFAEYGSKDASGTAFTLPESAWFTNFTYTSDNVTTTDPNPGAHTKKLKDTEANAYTMSAVLNGWDATTKTVAPCPPQGMEHSGTTLSWTAVTGASCYLVLKNDVVQANPTATNSTISATGSDKIQVIAVGQYGALSDPATLGESGAVTPTLPTLDTPATTASVTSNTSVSVSWSAITNATSYNVKICDGNGANCNTYNTSSTTYNASGLTPGNAYQISVQATGNAANYTASPYSDPATVTPKLNVPAKVTVSNLNATSFNVNWEAVPSATSYKVKVCPANLQEPLTQVGNTAWTTEQTVENNKRPHAMTTVDLTPANGPYILEFELRIANDFSGTIGVTVAGSDPGGTNNGVRIVTGENDNKFSSSGVLEGVMTPILNPAVSTTLQTYRIRIEDALRIKEGVDAIDGSSYIQFRNQNQPNNTGNFYVRNVKVYRLTASGCTEYTVTGGNSVTTEISGLQLNTEYSYRVKAVCASPAEETPYSAWETVTTLSQPITILPAPTNVKHSSVTDKSFDLTWNAVEGATGYEVEVCHEEETESGGGSETTETLLTLADFTTTVAGGVTKNDDGSITKQGGATSTRIKTATKDLRGGSVTVVYTLTTAGSQQLKLNYDNNDSGDGQVINLTSTVDHATATVELNTATGTDYLCFRFDSKCGITIHSLTVTKVIESGSDSGSVSLQCDTKVINASTGITIDGLDSATTYTYKVRSVNSEGKSAYSTEDQVTTLSSGTQKQNPTAPTGLTAVYGQTLNNVTLPEGWSWVEASATSVGNAGTQTFHANFAENETYNAATNVEVTITVGKAAPTAGLFSCSNSSLTYDGSAKSVSVTTMVTGMGAITVKYKLNGSATVPVEAGTYAISISVAEGSNYLATTSDIELGCTLTVVSQPEPLGSVTNVLHSNVNSTSFKLSWDAVAGATGYKVEICSDNIGKPAKIWDFSSWTIDGVVDDNLKKDGNNERFDYQVERPSSATLVFANGDAIPDTEGLLFTVTADGKNKLRLGYGTAYQALMLNGGNITVEIPCATGDTIKIEARHASSSGISRGFRVAGGTFSAVHSTDNITIVVDSCKVDPNETGTWVYMATANAVKITTTAGMNVKKITVVKPSVTSEECKEYESSTNSITIPDLTPATTYTYKVKAVNSEGESSDYSDEGQVITLSAGTQKETPIPPVGLTAVYGQTLNDVNLPDGWSWVEGLTTFVGNAGTQTFHANFTENETYNAATNVEVTITVSKATPTADLFSCSDGGDVIYDGEIHSVSVTTTAIDMGAITVKYKLNGSETEPVETGTYAISISVAEGSNYLATTSDIELGCTLTIVSQPEPLGSVTNVIHSNVNSTSFKLSWDAVAGATGYEVEICSDNIGKPSKIWDFSSWTVDGVVDDNLKKDGNNERFDYQVEKPSSAALVFANGDAIPDTEGLLFTVTAAGTNKLRLGYGTAYQALMLNGKDIAVEIPCTSGDTVKVEAKHASNDPGISRGFRVAGGTFNAAKSSSNITVVVDSCKVNPGETGTWVYTATAATVKITTTAGMNVKQIMVISPATSSCEKTEITDNSIIFNDLVPVTKYTYQVKALKGSEESEFSPAGTLVTANKWTGNNSKWNDSGNWDSGQKPNATSDVIIPHLGNGKVYPLLTGTKENNVCNTITFEAGAEIGRQDLLTYNKAYVQYGFGESASRDRWHMLSSPLQGVVTGDFAYGGYPKTFLRKFDTSNSPGKAVAMGTWTNAYPNYDMELEAGEGFALWVNPDNEGSEFGLSQTGGIIQLPFFEDPVLSAYHRIHKYEGSTSIFTAVNGSLELVESNTTPVGRSTNNFRLNGDIDDYSVEFSSVSGNDVKSFALIGNPFMSTIDFEKIYEASDDNIKKAYQIWTGIGFATYGELGGSGTILNMGWYIAPQQAFLVEKIETGGSNFNIDFTIAGFTTTGIHATLRSSSLPADKLDIVASNDKGSVLTYIAKREFGSLTFGNSDTRKLVTGVNAMPEIYSLKESSSGGLIAAGTSVINTDNTLIPLGLSTSWEGNIALTFKGMDRYDAQIKFIDLATGTEIDLTGLDAYEYPFDYSPAKDADNKPIAGENRFFIQFAPTAPTGLTDVIETVHVYNDKQAVYVVSSDKINQVFIYDLRGVLVYANDRVESSHLTVPKEFNRSEVYIVKVATEKGVKNVKLINK